MSLENTLKELARGNRKITPYCAFWTLYLSLPKEDQKALDEAIAKKMPQNIVVRALRKEGHKASTDTFRAHVRGDCRCPKK